MCQWVAGRCEAGRILLPSTCPGLLARGLSPDMIGVGGEEITFAALGAGWVVIGGIGVHLAMARGR